LTSIDQQVKLIAGYTVRIFCLIVCRLTRRWPVFARQPSVSILSLRWGGSGFSFIHP
jgi:hypothetical protein